MRDPSVTALGQRRSLKRFCCYLGASLLNLGFNSSANKLAPLPGTRLKMIPRKNDIVLDLVVDGEQRLDIKKVVHFSPSDSTLKEFILQ